MGRRERCHNELARSLLFSLLPTEFSPSYPQVGQEKGWPRRAILSILYSPSIPWPGTALNTTKGINNISRG